MNTAGFWELSRAVRDGEAGFRVGEVTVVAVVAVHRGDLLLVNEFRAAVGEMVLQMPMGKVLPEGRDPLACAEDELAEETGRSNVWRWGGCWPRPGGWTRLCTCSWRPG